MKVSRELSEVWKQYGFEDRIVEATPYGNGHINDTILVELQMPSERVILQRINHKIFSKPEKLMENIILVTEWIAAKIQEEGGDTEREVLQIIPLISGERYYKSTDGNYYRAYRFIKDGLCLEKPRSKEDFYESGIAFGKFQGQLADFSAEKLYEIIPDFHNTRKRFATFEAAVNKKADENRCREAADEISYAESMEYLIAEYEEAIKKDNIPLRVTHNDTKLNNAMLDAVTQKALCVLDLDTVMPGYSMNDFGDSIRFGTNTACEDEKDLSKVGFDADLFKVYVQGFLEGTKNKLMKEEIRLFPLGAKIMTYECGIRFLTDYLEGDVYFKTAYPEHNLVRAKNQFALLKDMEAKTTEMNRIVEECL